ncbi:hypothetical protein [Herbaspirillum sp.]|uniref:hypothetical protein n=1 Tax=Herbaspirillum sp. TaxID=1890675 RepID=UPI000C0D846F|nr:hypothetical protein [Herbaspirillum sp.]MBO18819.1 hypothetical protein [Herbaspirillum sp.]
MPPTITVQTSTDGPREVPTKWAGQWLAVHRPVRRDGLSTAPALWTVTLKPLGLSGGEIAAPLRAVLALAKAWDTSAARWDDVTAAADATAWQWRDRFRDDKNRVRSGRPALGPRDLTPTEAIESAGTAAEVAAAVAAAMGAPQLTDAEAAAPYPVADMLPADRVRVDAVGSHGWPEVRWARQWWPVPTVGEVHAMALDSVAETPDGRTVEPDHPQSWPRLLGLI